MSSFPKKCSGYNFRGYGWEIATRISGAFSRKAGANCRIRAHIKNLLGPTSFAQFVRAFPLEMPGQSQLVELRVQPFHDCSQLKEAGLLLMMVCAGRFATSWCHPSLHDCLKATAALAFRYGNTIAILCQSSCWNCHGSTDGNRCVK